MDCQLDIFFLEAILNGLLLGGLLALLALGLNLVFGVIDVVWICYAELVMVGMYGIYYAEKSGVPFLAAALLGIALVAVCGVLLHYLVIQQAFQKGFHEYDFLKGNESYKNLWSNAVREEMQFIAFNMSPHRFLHQAVNHLNSFLEHRIRGRHAPQHQNLLAH